MPLQQRIHGTDGVDDSQSLQSRIPSEFDPAMRFNGIRIALHDACVAALGPELQSVEIPPETLRDRVRAVAAEALVRRSERLTTEERQYLVEAVIDDVLGYGPIDPFLRDRTVTEIMVNGHEQVFI